MLFISGVITWATMKSCRHFIKNAGDPFKMSYVIRLSSYAVEMYTHTHTHTHTHMYVC